MMPATFLFLLTAFCMTDFDSPYFAAIDLGSNSFHMIIARINDNTVETVDKVKEMVQIARGMDRSRGIAEDAEERAIDCLRRFAERLGDIPASQVRAVGTRSLRSARNAKGFINRAEDVLGHPIAIISGYEEARLVYSGLAHCVTNDNNRRLVVDIGGASTEFIVGVDERPELLESLNFGCVSYTEKAGLRKVSDKGMESAYLAACAELEQIRPAYISSSWDIAYGTSGTMRAIAELLAPVDGGAVIQNESLAGLWREVSNNSDKVLKELPKLRRDVLPAGIAILKAVFDELQIAKLHVADATLKDGLIFDTIGRLSNEDARHSAVAKLQSQYRVDTAQAERVSQCAVTFWQHIEGLPLPGVSRTKILAWAAKLHEVGLGISHSGHHHHSFYILRHSDLAGFGRYEQIILANLVRAHRKKLNEERFEGLEPAAKTALYPMVLCLRLAVVLHRRRENVAPLPALTGKNNHFVLTLPPGWLADHPLTATSLQSEIGNLSNIGMTLAIEEAPEH